jgi:hypothetical protein
MTAALTRANWSAFELLVGKVTLREGLLTALPALTFAVNAAMYAFCDGGHEHGTLTGFPLGPLTAPSQFPVPSGFLPAVPPSEGARAAISGKAVPEGAAEEEAAREADEEGFACEADEEGFACEADEEGFAFEADEEGFAFEADEEGFAFEADEEGFAFEADEEGFTFEADEEGFAGEADEEGAP